MSATAARGVQPTPPSRAAAIQVAVLAAAVVAAYANTARNGFVWDDNDIIVANPANRDLGSIPALFSSVDATRTARFSAYYRPLTRLTYVLDYHAFGLDPAGYHLENLVLQALAAIALYAMARSLFGDAARAFVAALIFAVHPVNSEAVDFLATRNTILSTLFVLLAVTAYRYRDAGGGRGWALAAWAAFFAGLLCKETASTLLLVLPFCDVPSIPELRSTLRARAAKALPFLLLFIAYLGLRVRALSGLVGSGLEFETLAARLARNAWIVPAYLRAVLWPARLNAYHLVPDDWSSHWPALLAAWVAIAISVALLLRLRSRPVVFGLGWFALNLVPVSGIVPIPSAPMAERYLFLPAIGLWIVAADLACRTWERAQGRARLALAALGVALVLAGAAATRSRNRVWRDPVAFYTAMAEASPDAALAQYSLGIAQMQVGDVAAAREAWSRAAAIDPAYFGVATQLGQSYLRSGELDSAERWLEEAVRSNPGDAASLFNLAVLKEKRGDVQGAVRAYQSFIRIAPAEMQQAAAKARFQLEALARPPAPSR